MRLIFYPCEAELRAEMNAESNPLWRDPKNKSNQENLWIRQSGIREVKVMPIEQFLGSWQSSFESLNPSVILREDTGYLGDFFSLKSGDYNVMESCSLFSLTFKWKCLFIRNFCLWNDFSLQQLNKESNCREKKTVEWCW